MALRPEAHADADDHTLVLTRLVDAPRPLVFLAWTQAEHVARWWGPQGFTTTFCQMDIRVGGRFRLCMRSPEGIDYWKQGVYREIIAPERIVFTFAWEDTAGQPGHQTLVTVRFEEEGDRTRITLRQAVFESTEQRDSHVEGWTSCLHRFADYVATVTP